MTREGESYWCKGYITPLAEQYVNQLQNLSSLEGQGQALNQYYNSQQYKDLAGQARYLTFEACSFNHTGAGTTDIALTVTSATRLNDCRFNGFYRNVSWTNEPLILTACHSTNTTGDAIRMYGDGVGAFYSSGCRWDVATVPAWLGSLVKQGTALPVLYDTAPPTTLTWPRVQGA